MHIALFHCRLHKFHCPLHFSIADCTHFIAHCTFPLHIALLYCKIHIFIAHFQKQVRRGTWLVKTRQCKLRLDWFILLIWSYSEVSGIFSECSVIVNQSVLPSQNIRLAIHTGFHQFQGISKRHSQVFLKVFLPMWHDCSAPPTGNSTGQLLLRWIRQRNAFNTLHPMRWSVWCNIFKGFTKSPSSWMMPKWSHAFKHIYREWGDLQKLFIASTCFKSLTLLQLWDYPFVNGVWKGSRGYLRL